MIAGELFNLKPIASRGFNCFEVGPCDVYIYSSHMSEGKIQANGSIGLPVVSVELKDEWKAWGDNPAVAGLLNCECGSIKCNTRAKSSHFKLGSSGFRRLAAAYASQCGYCRNTNADSQSANLAWGKAQGGHGGRAWSPVHVAMRTRHLSKFLAGAIERHDDSRRNAG